MTENTRADLFSTQASLTVARTRGDLTTASAIEVILDSQLPEEEKGYPGDKKAIADCHGFATFTDGP